MRKAKSKQVLRCLPYFFIIGAQKCGTSDLFQMMGKHQQIDAACVKEPHYWSWQRPGKLQVICLVTNFRYFLFSFEVKLFLPAILAFSTHIFQPNHIAICFC
jgi:hypothetical protein